MIWYALFLVIASIEKDVSRQLLYYEHILEVRELGSMIVEPAFQRNHVVYV